MQFMVPPPVIADLICLANTPTLDLKIYHLDQSLLSVALVIGPLVLPKENYPCNVL